MGAIRRGANQSMLEQLKTPPPLISLTEAANIAGQLFSIAGSVVALGGERDRNFLIKRDDASMDSATLLKVSNPAEPKSTVAMQCAAFTHLNRHFPSLPVQRLVQFDDGDYWKTVTLETGQPVMVRAFHFLPGVSIDRVEPDSRLMRNIGETAARLDKGLRGFFHPAAGDPLAWNIQCLDQVSSLLSYVIDAAERKLFENVFECFTNKVKPVLPHCRAQVIHNDLSYHNMLVDPANPYAITGVYDFGDMTFAPLLQELSIVAAEVPAGTSDPFARSADIVAGYHAVTPLEEREFSLLPDMMRARLTLCCIIESWAEHELEWQDEREHTDGWRQKAVAYLAQLQAEGSEDLTSVLKSACGIGGRAVVPEPKTAPLGSSWERRKRFLGNAELYSYEQPIEVVRGAGVWLYDAEGKAYLDAYNNVPHVGHCHPRVVDAIAKQTARLNTNTRYLYDQLPTYAEQLTATLPDGLEVCYFVSSGSEANDLAWRMAKAWTGHDGGLVLKFAYHGVTDAVFDLSPAEKPGHDGHCPHIVEIDAPDDFRGEWKRDVVDRGQRFAAYCDKAIAQLDQNGHRPSAFFMDMIMSTYGIMLPPPGYLPAVYDKVRAAGGLCVADEVQTGFGRLGKAMWGFETAGGTPDIVTLGKPIASGYPMGMVVTRREIAQHFEKTCEFFSTTGGNPVACAAASAVLSVVQEQNLMQNAEHIGDRIIRGISELASQYPCIGDVRGSGLFIGVDLICDPQTLRPDPALAKAVANGLKQNGVLVGIDGLDANVLKIRPPMVFNQSHCARLLDTLEKVLQAVSQGVM